MSKAEPSSASDRPVIGITMGEPAGIGPEVIVKALADPAIRSEARFVIYAMNELLACAADLQRPVGIWPVACWRGLRRRIRCLGDGRIRDV